MNNIQACESIVSGLDELLTVADENYSDISQFLEDSERYLDSSYKIGNDALYTTPISTGGDAFVSIDKACAELIKVKAFTEALYIYQSFVDRLKSLKSGLSKDDVKNIDGTIEETKKRILDTMKLRDDYVSLRKSTLAKYSAIIKEKR